MKVSSLIPMLKNRIHRDEIYSKPDYWDAKAMEYAGEAISMWPNNHLNYYYHQEQLQMLSEILPDVNNLTVLDAGCGTGRMSRYLASKGAHVVGIDFSSKVIEIAKKESAQFDITYRVQSFFELDDREMYDLALTWASITVACKNRTELEDVMSRIYRALKPNGKALFFEPIHRGFLHRVLNMSLDEFIQVMKQVGYDIQTVVHLHFWPTRLLLAYIHWPKFITAAGFALGNGIMKLVQRKAFGDYKVIFAKKS